MNNRKLCCAAAVVVICALAGGALASGGKPRAERARSAAVSDVETMGKVDPAKALLYVIRPTSFGYSIETWTFCDDRPIGINRGKSYFFAYIEPGTHLIWSKSENISPYEMNFEAGKTYYIKESMHMGAFQATVKIEPIDEAKAQAAIESDDFKMLSLTDAGLRRAAEKAADGYSVAREKWAKRKDVLEKKSTAKPQGKSRRR